MRINSDVNVLIYAHLFPPSKGGMQFSNLEIAKGLHELGYNVSVIACSNKGIRKFASELPFPVVVLPKWSFTSMSSLSNKGLANWLFVPLYFYLIKMSIKKYKPDIILISDETANAFWGLFSRFVNRPYLSYCSVPHLTYPRQQGSNLLRYKVQSTIRKWMGASYVQSKKVLAVSHSTKSELIKEIPVLKKKIEVVPRSIDPKFFNEPFRPEQIARIRANNNINSDDYVLLTVSRLAVGKGISDVINAIGQLNPFFREKMKYIILGSGPHDQNLKKLARDLHIENIVIFGGAVPHDQLIPFYDACEIFIMVSRRGKNESFGRVFVEAAARRKPSIGVNAGGMVDIIENGKNGFLIEPGDIIALKEILENVLSNRKLSEKMGNNSRKVAEAKFSRREVAVAIERNIKTALKKQG